MTPTPETDPQELYRDPDINGCVHCRAPADCDECETERAHRKVIESLVANLDLFANEALANVAKADAALRELTSNHVYDIELAEGADGPDGLAELADADRHLRNVCRIVRERKRLLKEGY
jgi:hypothetical protein